ncbi:MAG: hypothetical protein IPN56_09310 [Chitinophagaceae bacterium]|nr:hypothetical protein [Chitinophagaceae bacterium]
MDPLFLGVFNVVPGRLIGVLCRKHPGRYSSQKRSEDTIEFNVIRPAIRYQSFDSVTERNSYGAQMSDSLVEMLHSDITNTTEIYFAARTVTANLGYYYTNSKSFDQLKMAGLLRYIKNKDLLDSIGTYYASFQWLANQIDLLRLKMDEIHKANARLFDSYVFQQMMVNIKIISNSGLGGQRTNISKPLVKPTLLSADVMDINTVSLNYHYYSTTIKFYIRNAIALQNRAKGLIEMIKKEYRFD